MGKKMLLLILLSFSLAGGGFWALRAQDPPPTKPSTVRTDPPTVTADAAVQTDLSGTYAGIFKCEAAGLTGDTTLTINGNEFTTSDGKTGRIVASTTKGYTAVVLQVPGADATAAPTIISLRGRKSGNRLTLTSVAGSGQTCSFVTSRNVAKSRRQRTPAATGTDVANPAAVPSAVPTESPVPSQTPSPSPTPSPIPPPSPSPTPSGTPAPSPEPAPSPVPSPTDPVPTPVPPPSPSPTPSPSPSPSPTPR